jgi:hypothetical protein
VRVRTTLSIVALALASATLPGAARATVLCTLESRSLGSYWLVPQYNAYGCYGPIAYSVVDRNGGRLAELQIGEDTDDTKLIADRFLFYRSLDWNNQGLMVIDLHKRASRMLYERQFRDFLPSAKGTRVALIDELDSLVLLDAKGKADPWKVAAVFADGTTRLARQLGARGRIPGRPRMLEWSSDDRTFWFYVEDTGRVATFASVRDGVPELSVALEGFLHLAPNAETQRQVFDADRGLVFHHADAPLTHRKYSFELLYLTDLERGLSAALGDRARSFVRPTWNGDGSCDYVIDQTPQHVENPEWLLRIFGPQGAERERPR